MDKSQQRILIHAEDASALAQLLQQATYAVDILAEPSEFMRALSRSRSTSQLVLLDDVAIARECLGDYRGPSLLLIDPSEADAALETAVTDCLLRPLHSGWLLRRVERLLHEAAQPSVAEHESELQYRNLFESANDAILLVNIKTSEIVKANAQATRLLGYPDVATLQAANFLEIEAGEGTPETAKLSNKVTYNEGNLINITRYRRRDGSLVPVETSSRTTIYNGLTVLLIYARDITERQRTLAAEKEQRRLAEALRDAAAALNDYTSLDDVLATILHYVSQVVPSESRNLMLIDEEGIARITQYRGYEMTPTSLNDVQHMRFKVADTPNLKQMMATKEPLIVHDTSQEAVGWVNQPETGWIKSHLSAPIVRNGAVLGFINLDSAEINTFSSKDAKRLQAFANQAAVAIDNAMLFQHVQDHATNMEQRVAERTTELTDSNAKLRAEIAHRQAIEESLKQERTLLRTLIDTIPDLIYSKDVDGCYTLVNKAQRDALAADTFGAVIGYDPSHFWTADNAETLMHWDQQVLETGQPVHNIEQQITYPDGNQRALLMSKIPLWDAEQEQPIGMIGISRDVTDLKQAEAHLEQVLNSARCLLWAATVYQDETDYVLAAQIANEEAAQRLWPLATTDMPSYIAAWEASILPEDRKLRQATLREQLEQAADNYRIEFRCRLDDGSLRWFTEEVEIRQQETHWMLVGVVTDITARKQAQERLQEINRSLEQRVAERTEDLRLANTHLLEQVEERERAENAERKQRLLAEALRESGDVLNSSLERDVVLDHLLEAIADIVEHDAANIMLINDDGETFRIMRQAGYTHSLDDGKRAINEYTALRYVIETGDTHIIADTHSYPDWLNADGEDWIRSDIVVPIPIEGIIIGFLTLQSRQTDAFTQMDAEYLLSFANQAGIAIRNARLLDEVRRDARQLDQRVQERTVALKQEQAQLSAILDAIRDGVIYTDLNNRVQFTNQALTHMTGYSASAWQQHDLMASILLPEKESDSLQDIWRRAQRHLDKNGVFATDLRLMRADESIFEVSLVQTIVHDADNHQIGILTVLRDISQEKELERQKARFIASASHELRTPIANLKTRLFLMRRKPANMPQHMSVAEQAVNWMQRLVEDMFDLARFERGVIELQREEINLQSFLAQGIHFQELEAERQEIDITADMPEAPITVHIDPYRFMQVFSNLLSNAIRYTPEEGTVSVVVMLDEVEVVIEVRDTGPGIAKEHQKQLFQPFFKADHDTSGAGLGLSISQEIVHAHGGTIAVESDVGQGTIFIVRLTHEALAEQAVE